MTVLCVPCSLDMTVLCVLYSLDRTVLFVPYSLDMTVLSDKSLVGQVLRLMVASIVTIVFTTVLDWLLTRYDCLTCAILARYDCLKLDVTVLFSI